MTLVNRLLLITSVLAATLGLDQLTKWVAAEHLTLTVPIHFLGDSLRLQLAHNSGAFLSLGASLSELIRQNLLLLGSGGMLGALLVFSLLYRTDNKRLVIALALVFSGGISNLLDRIYHDGYVIDFLNIGLGRLRSGIFNIADIAIMVGAIMLLFIVSPVKDNSNRKINE